MKPYAEHTHNTGVHLVTETHQISVASTSGIAIRGSPYADQRGIGLHTPPIALGKQELCSTAHSRCDQSTEAALPEAWRGLVDEQDELLLELVADRVENLCGFKPDPELTLRFLKNNLSLRTMVGQAPVATAAKAAHPVAAAAPDGGRPETFPGATQRVGFTLSGEFRPCRSAIHVLVQVMEAFAVRDALFLEKFIALPRHGAKRRWVARDKYDLYPGRPDLAERYSHQLASGDWLGTNYSAAVIRKVITTACQVAGLRYGSDLTATLG